MHQLIRSEESGRCNNRPLGYVGCSGRYLVIVYCVQKSALTFYTRQHRVFLSSRNITKEESVIERKDSQRERERVGTGSLRLLTLARYRNESHPQRVFLLLWNKLHVSRSAEKGSRRSFLSRWLFRRQTRGTMHIITYSKKKNIWLLSTCTFITRCYVEFGLRTGHRWIVIKIEWNAIKSDFRFVCFIFIQ